MRPTHDSKPFEYELSASCTGQMRLVIKVNGDQRGAHRNLRLRGTYEDFKTTKILKPAHPGRPEIPTLTKLAAAQFSTKPHPASPPQVGLSLLFLLTRGLAYSRGSRP